MFTHYIMSILQMISDKIYLINAKKKIAVSFLLN